MRKLLYDGPMTDKYIDGNFHDNMCAIPGSSRVMNETFPNPQNPRLIGFVRNVWNLDGVTVLYAADYKVTSPTSVEGIKAIVTLDGPEQQLGEVERKIYESLEKELRYSMYPTERSADGRGLTIIV